MNNLPRTAKKIILCAIVLLSLSETQAQSDTSFEKKVANEFCEAFTKKAPEIKKEQFEVELGVLILPILSKYENEFKKQWGLDINNKDDLQKLGFRIGQSAALNCPAFLSFISSNMDQIKKDTDEMQTKVYNGTLLKVETQQFSYLLVKGSNGKTDKIWWLEYFEGADKLSANASKYLNKPISVSYKEMEIYDAVNKEYKTIKIATKLEL